MDKKKIVRTLEDIALYLEIKGENSFKISAYRRAAQTLETDERSMEEIGDASVLKGVGKATAEVIHELMETGESSLLTAIKSEVPEGLLALLRLPGMGGKTIARLYQELGITDMTQLQQACQNHHLQTLSGFGAKSEQKILKAIEDYGKQPERLPIAFLLQAADHIEEQLEQIAGIKKYSRAGSLRRVKETSKDLDYVIATETPAQLCDSLVTLTGIQSIIASGETKVSVLFAFEYELQVDFRLVAPEAFVTTLHHFTGSSEHNVQMRQLAKDRDEKISEYGVEQSDGSLLTFDSETAFFQHFGLPYIPPELREAQTDVTHYRVQSSLLQRNDVITDLHMHTTWSDGGFSIEEMVEAARHQGYHHIAITDHSQSLVVAKGLNEERWLRQYEKIQALNEKYADFTILAGTEMDILADGRLDFSDDLLSQMDIVIASIHSAFSQSEADIMHRLNQALNHPHVDIIAHPTGRVIGRREGYRVNVDALIKQAAETKTALELNANPNRLDLNSAYLRQAQDLGVPLVINTDSHTQQGLKDMRLGISTALKAGLSAESVLNTWSLEKLRQFLQRND